MRHVSFERRTLITALFFRRTRRRPQSWHFLLEKVRAPYAFINFTTLWKLTGSLRQRTVMSLLQFFALLTQTLARMVIEQQCVKVVTGRFASQALLVEVARGDCLFASLHCVTGPRDPERAHPTNLTCEDHETTTIDTPSPLEYLCLVRAHHRCRLCETHIVFSREFLMSVEGS